MQELLHLASWRMQEVVREHLEKNNVCWRDFTVLQMLGAGGPLTQVEIGNRLGIPRASVTHVVDRLAGRGWAFRANVKGDARLNRVTLTASGRAVASRALRMMDDAEEQILGPLGEMDRAVLTRLLEAVAYGPQMAMRASAGNGAGNGAGNSIGSGHSGKPSHRTAAIPGGADMPAGDTGLAKSARVSRELSRELSKEHSEEAATPLGRSAAKEAGHASVGHALAGAAH